MGGEEDRAGSRKKVEIFEWCELKNCAKRVGIGNLSILSDEDLG